MHLMRVVLPDLPGMLGAVATALGTEGADIMSVEIVGRQNDMVIDDFLVQLGPDQLPDHIVSACQRIPGVSVDWIGFYPEGGTLESDLEALDAMLREQGHEAESLTGSVVPVFHVHWAVLVGRCSEQPTALFATAKSPDLTTEQLCEVGPFDQLRTVTPDESWAAGWRDVILAIAPVPGDRAIMMGRQGGPGFLPSEMARFGHLAALVPTSAV